MGLLLEYNLCYDELNRGLCLYYLAILDTHNQPEGKQVFSNKRFVIDNYLASTPSKI